jgi:threonine synthase
MRFHSTRGAGAASVPVGDAIWQGLAGDGGLYVPDSIPSMTVEDFQGPTATDAVASRVLAPFFAGDVLQADLETICREALDFPLPVIQLPGRPAPAVLELFHGPTCAFKDVGARFLAACLSRLQPRSGRATTILVATSGDTGGAVAAAFHNKPGFRVVILYPEGLVSPRQAHQLSCWGGNVHTFSVSGTFDDCQRLVKSAFSDPDLSRRLGLNSANSINLGRLLPQMSYYAASAVDRHRREEPPPGLRLRPRACHGPAGRSHIARRQCKPAGPGFSGIRGVATTTFASNAGIGNGRR